MDSRSKYAIGLMSGTSADGVDAALIVTDGEQIHSTGPYEFVAYSADERAQILDVMKRMKDVQDHEGRIKLSGEIDSIITERHVDAVERLMNAAGISSQDVDVIGFHGQTLYHDPRSAFTLQAGEANELARRLKIPVVYDFRSLDMQSGGEGAPLVPIYHRALTWLSKMMTPVAIVNIGGVANVTYVGIGADLLAFDTGPGNVLLDEWIALKIGERLDKDGTIAASGQVDEAAVERFLTDPYFNALPPKSLDRYDFSHQLIEHLNLEDGAATLVEFTARSIALSKRYMSTSPNQWIIVGGGAKNNHLMERLAFNLDAPVVTGDSLGWRGDFLEAEAFGYLAVRHLYELPQTFPGTTGVNAPLTGGRLAAVAD